MQPHEDPQQKETQDKSRPDSTTARKMFKIGKRIQEDEDESIQVISTEIVRPASVENESAGGGPRSRIGTPVPPEEAEALIKIVEEHDRKSPVDNYMLASSRLMLRKQLRQQTIGIPIIISKSGSCIIFIFSRQEYASGFQFSFHDPIQINELQQ